MRAGRLRHRVTLQSPVETLDSHGQPVKTWADVADVWAGVEPLRGRERAAIGPDVHGDAQDINELDTRVPIRYRSDVTIDWRVEFEDRHFEIKAIIDPDMRHRELDLLCKEVV